MSLINTAITGIRISQLSLSTTGHNIVNAHTEGYSRQTVSSATAQPHQTSVGFIGSGVVPTEIFRNTEKYLVDRVTQDISELSELDSYLTNVTQLDNLFAGDKTNLAQSINKFFDAVNGASNDPASLLGRQLLLTETDLLASNFKQVESRLTAQNQAINTRLSAVAGHITSIGEQIGQINRSISDLSSGGTGQLPNDLLDKRDQLVRELSSYVDVQTIDRSDGSIDITIGQGQPLVIGTINRQLVAASGSADPARRELAFVNGNTTENVGRLMSGGELGGLLRVRSEALDPAFNALGRIALAITNGINEQHKLGIDLEGNLGRALFRDINDPAVSRSRILAYQSNANVTDRDMQVTIEDVSQLTTSDYELSFSGPSGRYSVFRLADGKVMAQGIMGSDLPKSIDVDGFSLTIASGTFFDGDRFLIQPTRTATSGIQSQIRRPEEFAFASPIRTSASSANQGGGYIVAGEISSVATPAFTEVPGALSPPIMIRFTSATTYDVLDNSDPANPVPLSPPLMNQRFTPGSEKQVFPTDPGGTTVSTDGAVAAQAQLGGSNGYAAENITITKTDPVTGFITRQPLAVAPNEGADSIAARLSALTGVKATASSQLLLSEFTAGSGGEALGLSLNGVDLTSPTFVPAGESLPQAVPNPLTADFLRDRINSSAALQGQGISASSDGEFLSIRSNKGVDLRVALSGTDGSVAVGENQAVYTGPATEITVGGTVDVQLAADMELSSDLPAGLFGANPTALSNYTGYQVTLGSGSGAAGSPQAGDRFLIGYNSDGSADNRNGARLLGLSTANILSDGNLNLQGAYGQLVEEMGILTGQARLSQSASESMLRQSMDALAGVSGVNLEEEAARLIQFEQHYNASARLIGLARDLFDTLLSM